MGGMRGLLTTIVLVRILFGEGLVALVVAPAWLCRRVES